MSASQPQLLLESPLRPPPLISTIPSLCFLKGDCDTEPGETSQLCLTSLIPPHLHSTLQVQPGDTVPLTLGHHLSPPSPTREALVWNNEEVPTIESRFNPYKPWLGRLRTQKRGTLPQKMRTEMS